MCKLLIGTTGCLSQLSSAKVDEVRRHSCARQIVMPQACIHYNDTITAYTPELSHGPRPKKPNDLAAYAMVIYKG